MESLTNQEEVELRTKIEALGLEVTKVPSKSLKQLDEVSLVIIIHSLHLSLPNCKHFLEEIDFYVYFFAFYSVGNCQGVG